MTAGTFNVSWDGRDDNGKEVVSGIYFYSFKANSYDGIQDFISTKKIVLMK
jgi:flagellar hook assembly protein FlgD